MDTPSSGQHDFEKQVTERMNKLESFLDPIFAKFPHIPQSAKDTLVNIAPWLAIVFGILGLGALFSLGALTSLLSPYMYFGGLSSIVMYVSILLGLAASVLQILAFKPLQERKKRGWNLIFYGSVLGAVGNVLSIIFASGTIGAVLGPIVGLWLLFEVRPSYK